MSDEFEAKAQEWVDEFEKYWADIANCKNPDQLVKEMAQALRDAQPKYPSAKEILNEADAQHEFGGGSEHSAFIDGASWAIEKMKGKMSA